MMEEDMDIGIQAKKCRKLSKIAKELAITGEYNLATKKLFTVCEQEEDLIGAFFIRCLLKESKTVRQATMASWMFREFLSETIKGEDLDDLFLHEFRMHIRTGNISGAYSCVSRMGRSRNRGVVSGISE